MTTAPSPPTYACVTMRSAQGGLLLLVATWSSGVGDRSCGWRAHVLATLVCGMGVGREVELAMSDWRQSDSL